MGISKQANDAIVAKVLDKRAPKTRRGRQIIRDREPKLIEDPKTALIMKGNKSSGEVTTLLRDLNRVRSPLSTLFNRTHDIHPFEDSARLEKECTKYDHNLFAFGSSSKKRPFRMIFGRLFDFKILDMIEYSVTDYKPVNSFMESSEDFSVIGSKPLVLFQGAGFETNENLKRTKSLLMDFFVGPDPDKVLLEGLDHVVVLSAPEVPIVAGEMSSAKPKVSVRRFVINKKKSGSRLPRVELKEAGPRFTLEVDRVKEPDREIWKKAIKVPKLLKDRKKKNVTTEETGNKRGTLHLGKQHFDQIHTIHHSKSKAKKLRADLGGGAAAASGRGGAKKEKVSGE